MDQKSPQKKLNSRALALIGLHVLLLVYSCSGIFSKNAAQQDFLSPTFILFYIGVLAMLGIYALGWQQILKRLPLTLAFANKAVTIVWGIIWGFFLFGESVTPLKLVGAAIIIVGVVMFSIEDGRQQEQVQAKATVKAEVGSDDDPRSSDSHAQLEEKR